MALTKAEALKRRDNLNRKTTHRYYAIRHEIRNAPLEHDVPPWKDANGWARYFTERGREMTGSQVKYILDILVAEGFAICTGGRPNNYRALTNDERAQRLQSRKRCDKAKRLAAAARDFGIESVKPSGVGIWISVEDWQELIDRAYPPKEAK